MRTRPASLLGLTAFWLLVVNETSAGQLVLGIALSLLAILVSAPFAAPPLPVRRAGVALRLLLLFLSDIVVANLAVTRAVLSPRLSISPRFVRVPLDLEEPKAVGLLAAMVTLTPGTVSVDIDQVNRVLTVHALLAPDPEAVVREIKGRYEAHIKEIFQC